MLNNKLVPHTNLDKLSQTKIPALKGRARLNNLRILETIAAGGPLLKYDVYKRLKKRGIMEYSTITRRIDSLKEKGYLNEAGRRVTERGKRKAEALYGLTWKGFIASFAGQKTKQDALTVLERNPLLTLPEKDFVLLVLKEVFDTEEIETVIELLLYGFIKIIPNLDDVKEDELPLWILQGVKEIPPDFLKVHEITKKKKDLTKLLDNPKILQYVKNRILPMISEWQRNFYALFQFFNMLSQIGDYIKTLRPEDTPSERLKEFLKTEKLEQKLVSLSL